jgi:hypothetical protein
MKNGGYAGKYEQQATHSDYHCVAERSFSVKEERAIQTDLETEWKTDFCHRRKNRSSDVLLNLPVRLKLYNCK